MEEKEMSFLEKIKVLFITLIVLLLPAGLISCGIVKYFNISFFITMPIIIGLELVLIFVLGLHKPAYTNDNNEEDIDEEDD